MSRILRFCLLAGVMAALLALPSGALAADYDGDAPKRVSSPADRALRALERAEGKIEDGDSGAAALKSVRRGLSKSLKAAKKRLGTDAGPDSAYVVAETQGEVAAGVADLLDGANDGQTAELVTTLKAALDGRDDLVAAIGALSDEDKADCADALSQIVDDATSEKSDYEESAADDEELTADGKAALEAAAVQAGATAAAAQAILDTIETDDGDAAGDGDHHGECHGGPRGEGGRRGGPGPREEDDGGV